MADPVSRPDQPIAEPASRPDQPFRPPISRTDHAVGDDATQQPVPAEPPADRARGAGNPLLIAALVILAFIVIGGIVLLLR